MSTITMFQVSRSLYKWRRFIALAVFIESIYSYKKGHRSKKKSKSSDELLGEISRTASRFATTAQEYIKEAKKRIER